MTNAYQFSDTMTWTLSKHTLKFGADIRYNDVDNQAAFNSKGSFTFDNLQAYMNNIASRVQQALQTSSWVATQWQSYFFAQDDFRVTPALTLNLGLAVRDLGCRRWGSSARRIRRALARWCRDR